MNSCLRLIVLGIVLGVALCQVYDGRRRPAPRPLPHPKPLPRPIPFPHPKPPSRCHGSCGGIAGTPCPRGYRCRYFPSSDFGTCCPSIVGVCPPPSPRRVRTRCTSRVRRCTTDKDCLKGFMCCLGDDRCGRVCKRPLFG